MISVRSLDLAGSWSSVGTATLTITAIENQPPTAPGQTVTTDEDTALPITVTATDDDGPSPPTFTVLDAPAHGALSGTAPELVYLPAADYHGNDSFTFTANDGSLDSAPATVTITIRPVNDRPTAAPATVSAQSGTPVPVEIAGADVDGDALTFRIVTPPAHGTLSGTAPALTYTSTAGYTGADSFRFSVSDGQVDSEPATVAISVTAAPPPPAPTPALAVADNPSRTAGVRPLDGAVFRSGASAYIFIGPVDGSRVRSVTFTLDGAPFSDEHAAPFDFAGTSSSRPCSACVPTAYPFESNLLTLGTHRIGALVIIRDGSRNQLLATFTVADTTPHGLFVSASRDRSAPAPLANATLEGLRYAFFGPQDDQIAGARYVVFRIDGRVVNVDPSAPYDVIGSTMSGIALPLDTRRMSKGWHRASATVVLAGGSTILEAVEFRVT